MKEIILDTETTGLDHRNGHRIVEIGAVKMYNKVLTGERFHYYINPERDMPTEAYRIHGISSEFLKTKPLFREIADEFLDFIKDGGAMVIHNAIFDVQFLNHELSLLNRASIKLIEFVKELQCFLYPFLRNCFCKTVFARTGTESIVILYEIKLNAMKCKNEVL